MKKFLCLLIFLGSLQAEESRPLVIDSEFADYDGTQFVLTGHATVEHELGKVEANCLTVLPEKEGKKLRFACLKMNEDVKISLLDGGQLSCPNAIIDYHDMTGRFWSEPSQEFVTYTEKLKDGKSTPIEVKSQEMLIRLSQNQKESSQILISQITAEQNVSVNYNNDYFAVSDTGEYQRFDPSTPEEKLNASNVPGLISLKSSGESGICQIRNKSGDLIDADQIKINTMKRELEFDAPHGFISYDSNQQKNSEIDFSCGTMNLNEAKDILILSDDVAICSNGIGKLTNPREIRIYRQLLNGKKQISLIESIGESRLDYKDEKNNSDYVLITHEKFTLDPQKNQAHFASPRDDSGNVVSDKQVHFIDPSFEIFADDAFINYKEVDKKMSPTNIFLIGNVCLIGKASDDAEAKYVKFAIADRVDYDIPTQEMIFSSENKKRVLFFDKTNNLQISAPSVKVKRNLTTKKDAIQGIGDVRFSFIDKEFNQLKKRFNLNSKMEVNNE